MSDAATAAPPPRRSRRRQAERRASTRARLLEATLSCLVKRGHAGTTTAEIEARAGVSRGARQHHFPTKESLMVAAVRHLFEGITERYAAGMETAPDGGEARGAESTARGDGAGAERRDDAGGRGSRFHRGYRLLWETYDHPAQAVVFELFVAARTDPALRKALRAMWSDHHAEVRRRANAYFPELAHRDANGLLETLQCAMAGLALRRLALGETTRDEDVLALLERMVGATFPPREGAHSGGPA